MLLAGSGIKSEEDFPGGSEAGTLPANSGDEGSSPVPGRFQLLMSN